MIEEVRRREPMKASVGWCFDRVRALSQRSEERNAGAAEKNGLPLRW